MKKVCVLMGGHPSEGAVSLSTAEGVYQSLLSLGYDAFCFEVHLDRPFDLIEKLKEQKPDVVFNALHGPFGEDGCIQGILEWLRIPYTHSGVMASAIAMDKELSKFLFNQHDVSTPKGGVYFYNEVNFNDFDLPIVVKPINYGSSVGVSVIQSKEDLENFLKEPWIYGDKILIEEYIKGREIQIGIMGNEAVGAIEIKSHNAFLDYQAKYTKGFADRIMPAPLDKDAYETICQLGLKAHQVLGCRGVSRIDSMYDPERNRFYILEVNSQPGMTPTSAFPLIANHKGFNYEKLIDWIVQDASINR